MSDAEVYVGKDVEVEIWDDGEGTEYVVAVAQVVTFNPAQDIEGVDGLESDLVQVWAPKLKTYAGSLTQLMVSVGDQLELLAPFQTTLTEYVMYLGWDTGVAGQRIQVRLAGVIFPSGGIPSPKNDKVILEMPFRAKSATISQS